MLSRLPTSLASASRAAPRLAKLSSSAVFSSSPVASTSAVTLRHHRTRTLPALPSSRPFSTSLSRPQAEPVDEDAFDLSTVERVSDEVDVCIVGGGPAGLSAAIRLKQLADKEGRELRVVVLEKGAEIGQSPVPPLSPSSP